MNPLIQYPVLSWAVGQALTVSVTPLSLPAGRSIGDFSAFTLYLRQDPLWPRAAYTPNIDPATFSLVQTVTGSLVSGVPTFVFTMPSAAGIQLYCVDVWGALSAGGTVQLVKPQWVTGGGI